MNETSALARRAIGSTSASRQTAFLVVAVATTTVWGHTLDEIRVGEFSAVPVGTSISA